MRKTVSMLNLCSIHFMYLSLLTLTGRKAHVIILTRPNGTIFYINAELIQTVEMTPDTVITLVNNKKLIVKDSPQEIAERFIEYRRKTLAPFTLERSGGE